MRYEEVYKIGKIGKPHGIKGEVTLFFSDDVFDRTDSDYVVLCIDGILVPFFMEEYRFKTDETALVKFEGVDTQERAKELTGTEVFFPRELADNADDDTLSYAQLVGFTLLNAADGKAVGVVEAVDEQTINIMFELADGRLIPASEELIAGIDTEKKVITMIIPEGILEL